MVTGRVGQSCAPAGVTRMAKAAAAAAASVLMVIMSPPCIAGFFGNDAGRMTHQRISVSVFRGLHQISDDRFLAERLAGFEPMQPFDEDEAVAVATDQDRRLLA